MALAIYYEDIMRQGHVHDYAEIATLGHVTRARVTQIMNLRLLAPDIQLACLELPGVVVGRDCFSLRELQTISLQPSWKEQLRLLSQINGWGIVNSTGKHPRKATRSTSLRFGQRSRDLQRLPIPCPLFDRSRSERKSP